MNYQDFLGLSKKELLRIVVRATQQAQAERYKQRMSEVKWHLATTHAGNAVMSHSITNSKVNAKNVNL